MTGAAGPRRALRGGHIRRSGRAARSEFGDQGWNEVGGRDGRCGRACAHGGDSVCSGPWRSWALLNSHPCRELCP